MLGVVGCGGGGLVVVSWLSTTCFRGSRSPVRNLVNPNPNHKRINVTLDILVLISIRRSAAGSPAASAVIHVFRCGQQQQTRPRGSETLSPPATGFCAASAPAPHFLTNERVSGRRLGNILVAWAEPFCDTCGFSICRPFNSGVGVRPCCDKGPLWGQVPGPDALTLDRRSVAASLLYI